MERAMMRHAARTVLGTAFSGMCKLAGIGICAGMLTAATAFAQSPVQPGEAAIQPPPAVRSKGLSAEEFSSQSRTLLRRAPRRVRVYTPREPGPNSVRVCNAHYEQEFRPSGTVIVPKLNCYWSG